MTSRIATDDDKHRADVTALTFYGDRLYSGGDDGAIKIWSEDLKLLKCIEAHPVNVYSLTVIPSQETSSTATLYSSSSDCTIKAWCAESGQFKKDLISYDREVGVLHVYKDVLYAGDDIGCVRVFVKDKLKLIYNLLEEVKGLIVDENLMYTVRDLDLVITEFLSEESTRYMTRQVLEGKSPICLAGDKLCVVSRCGRKILCHHNNKEDKFKHLDEVEAHNLIINVMCSRLKSDGSVQLCSGGYDGIVKVWNISESGKLNLIKSVDLNTCINALCFGKEDQIFIGGSGGCLCRVDI